MVLRATRLWRTRATTVNAQQYMRHLFPVAGVDMLPINDIMPGPLESEDEAYRFQHVVIGELARKGGGPPNRKVTLTSPC